MARQRINVGNGGLRDLSQGSVTNAQNASLSIGAQSLLVVSPGFNPYAVFGNFTTGGLVHTAGTTLTSRGFSVDMAGKFKTQDR